jgi:hypothetical protein
MSFSGSTEIRRRGTSAEAKERRPFDGILRIDRLEFLRSGEAGMNLRAAA